MFWIENLRVVATISVIILHVSSAELSPFVTPSNSFWWIGNIYNSAVRFCVPIFVMLTGALLLSQHVEPKVFFKKRVLRVILPFAFFTIVYMIFNFSLKILQVENMTWLETTKWFFIQVRDGSSFHFWYIYVLIGLYLFIPIIGKWIRNSTEKEILYFLIIWLVTLFRRQPLLWKYTINIDLQYFTGYLGYLVLGYYLYHKSIKNKSKTNLISLFLIVTGIGITIFGTYFCSYYKGEFSDIFLGYLTPNVLMVSIGIFMFFKNNDITNRHPPKMIGFISKYSYGIYLIHVLILFFLTKVGITSKLINPLLGIPLTTLLCLTISALLIYILNKLPWGKYISG